MTNRKTNNWDMGLAKKEIRHIPRNIPKREVMPADFAMIRKRPPAPLKQNRIKKEPAPVVTPTQTQFKPSYSPLYALVAGALIIVLFVQTLVYLSGAKNDSKQILGIATAAYADLELASDGLKSQNFTEAEKLFQSAQDNLNHASRDLNKFWILTKVVPQAKSADNLLAAAHNVAGAGENLSLALGLFKSLQVNSEGIATQNFSQVLAQSKLLLSKSVALLTEADSLFDQVTSLPDEYQANVKAAQQQSVALSGLLQGMIQVEDLYLSLFGSQTKTYFIAFQNYDELRATGGFIGTYGILKISDGAIKELKIESIYNLDGALYNTPAAPGPFQPDIATWGTRDANWFADFPTSAQKIQDFYEQAKETTDGVIALTPKIFSDLLNLTGPIPMPEYDTELTAENFQDVVQLKTSVEYDKQLNQPKKFLADFAPRLLDRMQHLSQDQWVEVLQLFNENLFSKNILLYSSDPLVQKKIAAAGVAGKVLGTDSDYLYIVNSNQGGTKTDLEITQNVSVETSIQTAGSIQDKLTISRTNGSNLDNLSFMRVLLPFGSKVVSASGFYDKPQFSSVATGKTTDPDLAAWDKGQYVAGNLYQRVESGKTELSGWVRTKGVTTSEVTISYVLPFKVSLTALNPNFGYSLTFQKQPGATNDLFKQKISAPDYKLVWASPEFTLTENSAQLSSLINRDRRWSVLISQ